MNHGLLPILVIEVFLYEIGNNTILKQTDTLLFMTVTNRHSKNKVIMATSSLPFIDVMPGSLHSENTIN
jgi:NAD(P)H-nitrite reductase large subunit